ncbi:hypothetical protein ZIOFF_065929 [Zingiber officinale]|uniref:Uncharacterized protein n=1 Tax=Zingiber officinale TaxID=94328 RepID=A0A8J5F1X2_ZINOF|nr:hypothetical protein ZIOFF_065929 [Zingiber officinale]
MLTVFETHSRKDIGIMENPVFRGATYYQMTMSRYIDCFFLIKIVKDIYVLPFLLIHGLDAVQLKGTNFLVGEGCSLVSQCCNSYEYCVSCCLDPSRVTFLPSVFVLTFY